MRILQALHFFLPKHVAGVEVYTDALSRQLAKEHDVALLYSEIRPGEVEYSLRRGEHAAALTYELVNNRWFRSFEESYRHPAAALRIGDVLDEFRPDVLHVQHLMGLSIELPRLARQRDIPVVMTVHDHWLECAAGGQRFHSELGRCDELEAVRCGACTAHMTSLALRVRAFLERRALIGRPAAAPPHGEVAAAAGSLRRRWTNEVVRLGLKVIRVPVATQAQRISRRWDAMRGLVSQVDRFLVPSRYLMGELIRFGLPEDRILHCQYGFEVERFARRRELPELGRRFAFAGSIKPYKGVHLLLKAFETLPADAQLHVCGSFDDAPEYAAALRRSGRHPGVHFAGRLDPDQIPDFLAGIDCLVVPSIWNENSPLVIHESFLAGVPVVASRLGGHVELLGEGGGLLYEADDAVDLAAKLRRIYDERGLLRRLVAQVPPVKSMKEHAAELAALYQGLRRSLVG